MLTGFVYGGLNLSYFEKVSGGTPERLITAGVKRGLHATRSRGPSQSLGPPGQIAIKEEIA
jgi:hypothetical protein